MYTHYLLASYKINNPLKKYLTSIQIIQFLLIIIHSIYGYIYRSIHINDTKIQILYMISMLSLFGNFYIKKYMIKKID